MAQCQAKSKRTGKQCQQPAMHGMRVCYMHGGATKKVRGEASPHYKDGKHRRHKNIPARMVEVYEASARDPELLSLREEIALVDARIDDLLARVDTGESGRLWRMLGDVYDDFYEAHVSKDGAKMALYLMQMGNLIQKGMGDFAIWDEMSGILDQRRRLTDSEARRLKDMQAMISASEAMDLMGEIVLILRKRIDDPQILEGIYRDITGLFARSNVAEVDEWTGSES